MDLRLSTELIIIHPPYLHITPYTYTPLYKYRITL